MGRLTLDIRDDDLIDRLKSRAEAHGRSIEEEHREILREALQTPVPSEDFWTIAARIREQFRGRHFVDTTQLLREDRDRRAGLVPDDG